MKKIFLCALIVLLLSACQTRKNYHVHNRADRAVYIPISNWFGNYLEAIKKADVEPILSSVSDDITFMPPNQPSFSGKENLRKWLLEYFNYCSSSEGVSILEYEVYDGFAYLQGKYTIKAKIKKSGEEYIDNGKFINFFRRQSNGIWMCTQSIWNSDNLTYDIHTKIPAIFSGTWKLDLSKSICLPDIVSSILIITQKGNDFNLNKTYEIKDKDPVKSSSNYTIGDETHIKSTTGTFSTTSSWDFGRQTLTIIETLLSEKNGIKQEYKKISVYSLTVKGEILNIITDDILPEGSSIPINQRHTEMIYNKL
jgi:ketosteroid isomerase-like protein